MRRSGGAACVAALLLAPLALLSCAHAVPVDALGDPIAADRAAPADSILVVLPERCAAEPATHLFHGAIAVLDTGVSVDSASIVALLARVTEFLAFPVRIMHTPVLGEVVLTIGRDGRVRHYEARALRDAAAFPRAVSRALEVVRFPGTLERLGVGADSITIYLTYETGDRAPFGFARAFRAAPPSERAAVRPGTATSPRYPIEQWESGVEGTATMHFVVDTAGGVDPSAVVVTATDIVFARAVLDAIPRYAFTPARVGSCRISSLFELPFDFRLRR